MITPLCDAQQHAALTYADGRHKHLVDSTKPINLCAMPDKTFALILAQISMDTQEEGLVEAFDKEVRVIIAIKRLIAAVTIELAKRSSSRHLH